MKVKVWADDELLCVCDWIDITRSGALLAFDFDRRKGRDPETGEYKRKLLAAYNMDFWDMATMEERN